jgi:hypothetical protein
VLSLVLVILLVWFVFSVILGAWTLFFQGYIYSEPAPDLWWRAPAAATALTVFLLLWVVLDYRSINPSRSTGLYRELQTFSFTEEEEPYPELIVPNRDGKEEKYLRKRTAESRFDYRNGAARLPSRPDKVIAVGKDGQREVFLPDKDEKGHFKVAPNELLRYRDERGREMVEGYLGFVSTRHYSWLWMNLFLNFLHGVVWFLCLWLLLRYQWSHALGLAVVFWAVTMLFVLPQVLGLAEKVARDRLPPPAAPGAGHPEAAGQPSTRAGLCRIRANLDEQLAEVLAAEKSQEGPRRILQALHHVLPVLQPPRLQPAGDVAQELVAPALVVGDEEAADHGPLDEQRHQVGAGRRGDRVVL